MWSPTERRGHLAISVIFFCVGLFSILAARAMPFGEIFVPGPGFFPTLLGGLLCVVSLAEFVCNLPRGGTTKRVEIGHWRIWSTVTAIIVLGFLFEPVGFILGITLFVVFLLKILSPLKWMACILWAVASAIIAYLLFNFLLDITLPLGPWL